ncbi:ATP-dependent zinc metalloprotease YME1L-like [Lineus longissimus]|uniref:ATP-dependent zinc metalloprotease YME1L-like n=1 Tax=Lineus longissimus TaxID=88925 RepID=UPI00315C98B2
MFAITNQPQFAIPVVNLAAIANSRIFGSKAISKKFQHNSRSQRYEETTALAPEEIERVKSCLRDLGFEESDHELAKKLQAPILSVIEKGTKLEQFSDLVKSCTSSDTFYENKNGFPEDLSKFSQSSFNSALASTCHTILHSLAKPNYCSHQSRRSFSQHPTRGFKTKRSTSAEGLGGHKKKEDEGFSYMLKGSIFDKSEKSKTTDKLKSMLQEYETSPELQEKLKIAFAEGYTTHEKKSGDTKSSWTTKLLRGFMYAIGFYCIIQLIQVFSTVGGSMRGLGVLNREQYEVNPEEITVGFDDVRGADEAKQELQDVVEFLKNPEKFTTLGAKLPKGVLLVGPPGVGKTLLARSVAGEAGVPFFHASGSEFDEIFVGTGAKRVRQLFGAAKMRSPCVVFIDEIDTVGAKRTSSQIHPYANQTINQLLSEMDGFSQNEGVIVLGATNRQDNLDKALLRPGRFDVEVRVFAPDLKGRRDILNLYLSKVKSEDNVDIEKLARGTTGFTGADLENLVNQAALKAAMDEATGIATHHLEFARDKVMMGPAKKSRIPDEEINLLTAYHEAGHTLVAYFTKDAMPIHKVTIVPRGMSLGHTAFVPEKEEYNRTRSQLLAQMDVAMGGRVAEELIYGLEKVTTGASNDFQSATGIATAMVKQFGMSEKVGVRVFHDDAVDSGLSMLKVNEVSPATTELVDNEIKRFLGESYERARNILKTHSAAHKEIAQALMKYETLDLEDVKMIVEGKKIQKEGLP